MNAGAPREAELLICVYYRVGRADTAHAIALARDIQRTLAARFVGLQAQVLVRCELRAGPTPAASRDSGVPSAPVAAADDTVMETYRLPLPANPAHPAPVEAPEATRLLQALEAACAPLSAWLRGARHVEVFLPCAW